eukprot:TRINITY_DN3393_c0_g1_i1.p1 TRINITY_DN3393_c0_g1~~TRINITY_DN3393_c0_g1_i1.p1  ORF type:complete len:720 (+),score=117.95 TRINITY_DN3393_c0_g1_i1:110-2269(+)
MHLFGRNLAVMLMGMCSYNSYGLVTPPKAEYHVGVSIADVTGPAAEVVLMGYANSNQHATGIHMRLHARAFIFVDPVTGKRTAFINVDTWSATESLIQGLEKRLQQELPGFYTRQNVIVAGTHTHAAPAGTSPYLLFEFSSFGYVDQSTQSLIDGMVDAMKIAHGSIRPAHIFIGNASVDNTTVPGCPMPNCAARNRSPTSYLENSAEERARYDGDTEKNMDLIKIVDAKSGEAMGALNWFAVHPTSMRSASGLLSGDNKGYAEYLFERALNGNTPGGRGPFVAGFAQGAAGDVSPNINGSFCEGTGTSCDTAESVCYDKLGRPHNSKCLSHGPGKDMFESTKIIGERQFQAAKHIFDSASRPLGTGLDYHTRFVDMSRYPVQLPDGSWAATCSPAMGTAFAAGTTDGPSDMDDFVQHRKPTNHFLEFVGKLLATPPADVVQCHRPKDILLYTGGLNVPYPFVPSLMGFQLMRVGQLVVAAVPGEFTTMAGRRTREAIKKVLVEKGVLGSDGVVVLNNCASGYADYVTTYEEYQHQRYEGGSTAYGPHTHAAFTQVLVEMALEMASSNITYSGVPPSIPSTRDLIELQPGVAHDEIPPHGYFGGIVMDVPPGSFEAGRRVSVQMWGAHPRNNLRHNGTFASVWHRDNEGSWHLVADDNDPETRFEWRREGVFSSVVTVTWDIPADCIPGNYSLGYTGDAKSIHGHMQPIFGYSRIFEVL